jgi:Xaa-Pro dipeptidase
MAVPISASERQARIEKAQFLLQEFGFGALLLESGSALTYFTGIRWWRSERFTGALITADGDLCIVTPAFEEPSIREQMEFGEDVRTWEEHESPFALVTGYLAEKKLLSKPLAIEETVRNFITAGIRLEQTSLGLVSGRAVTRGCRMFKSEAEIALMQAATNVTMAAYRHVYPSVVPGMTPSDISGLMNTATQALGGEVDFSLVLLGDASAYPHGTGKPQQLREGDVVLMDCGCSVHGYKSDVSRSWVVGDPSSNQKKVWRTVKAGQQLALETMAIGVAAGRVDDVVRAFYAGEGYGPGYAAPGLTHRLGHGIGMDGHEPVNFVHGEQTPLAAGMCFSNEPGIYIPGEFGIRLEDCLHMSENGPVLFSALSPSIDDPFGVG